MITLFGYGMGGSLENIPVTVVDQSSGNITDMRLGSIKGMSLFDVKNITTDVDTAKAMVQCGDVKAAIILPPNYDDINDSQSKTVIIYLDSLIKWQFKF